MASRSRLSKSQSGRMPKNEAFKVLGLSTSASVNEINRAFTSKLDHLQAKHNDQPDRLVQEADMLYSAYRSAYLTKEGAREDQILPLTITGPDTLLNMFGINDIPHQHLQVQMESQAKYKDGRLVKQESYKTESFINADGKRETKVYENGKLIKHVVE